MPTGFEERQVAQSTLAPTAGEVKQGRIPLSPVQTPRPPSLSGVGSQERELSKAIGGAQGLLNEFVDRRMEEAVMDGKMAFIEGKTEQDIADKGNRFTNAGFMTMKLRTAGNEWFQNQVASIDSDSHKLPPDQYRQQLSDGFKEMMKSQAGSDDFSRRMLIGMSEQMLPKLVQQQTKAHNAYNKENTIVSYQDLLVSETEATPEDLQLLATEEMSGLTGKDHTNAVTGSIVAQLVSGTTALYNALTPGAETLQDFMHAGYTESQGTDLFNARSKFKSVQSASFNENRISSESAVLDGASTNLNAAKSFEEIKGIKEANGYTDAWANGMMSKVKSIIASGDKERKKIGKLNEAISSKNLIDLNPNDLAEAQSIMRESWSARSANDPRVLNASPEDRDRVQVDVMREGYYTEIATQDVIDKDAKLSISRAATIKTIIGADGKVSENAVQAFQDYQLLTKIGGKAYADEYLSNGYMKEVILLARGMYEGSTTPSEEDAITRAASLLDSEGNTIPGMSASSTNVVYSSKTTKLIDKELDEIIRPGNAVGRFIDSALGKGQSASGLFALKKREINQAKNDPRLLAELHRIVNFEYNNNTNTALDTETRQKLAVGKAMSLVGPRLSYVAGKLIFNDSNSPSLDTIAGVQGKKNALNAASISILAALGTSKWGEDFNKFQIFSKAPSGKFIDNVIAGVRGKSNDINDASISTLAIMGTSRLPLLSDNVIPSPNTGRGVFLESVYDSFRGAGSFDVQYHAGSESLIFRPFTSKDQFDTIDDPLVIPVKTLGRFYKAMEDNDADEMELILDSMDPSKGELSGGLGDTSLGGQAGLDDLHTESSQIQTDENVRSTSYKDSKGLLTGGVGHLLATREEQKLYPEGSNIPEDVIAKWYEDDLKEAVDDVTAIFGDVPNEQAKDILTNMAFNLGRPRLNGFTELKKAVSNNDFSRAADEMQNSKWRKDVKGRATRLIERMRALGTAPPKPGTKPKQFKDVLKETLSQ